MKTKQIEKHLEIIKDGVRSLTFDELLKADRLEIMKAILRTCDEVSEEIGVMVGAKKNRDADASIVMENGAKICIDLEKIKFDFSDDSLLALNKKLNDDIDNENK